MVGSEQAKTVFSKQRANRRHRLMRVASEREAFWGGGPQRMFRSLFCPARLSARAVVVSLIALASVAGDAVAQTYVLGSPNGSLNSDAWALDAANMSAFRAAI